MVQGTSSSAGKTFLVTALCRLLARRGLRVAPFKAVNMSNNARVVAGGEISSAQWLQARAAGIEPDVRMNPILVKPESSGSQVVVSGRVDPRLSSLPWERRPAAQWPVIREALADLAAAVDVVVIEGAGSPAEINLARLDVANMRVAAEADAPVLLVADIDRGGAFAHLYGTWSLVEDRHRIRGFVLNRFRGDPLLLGSGPAHLAELTGVPVVGVVPFVPVRLPEEDAYGHRSTTGGGPVAVLRYPSASNLDELVALEELVAVDHLTGPADLDGYTLVILPGSKDVPADLAWLRATGLADAVAEAAARGRRVLGMCGGMQMLGGTVTIGGTTHHGLGLLPVGTTYEPDKLVASGTVRLYGLDGPWAAIDGTSFRGYEIRQGRHTVVRPRATGTDAAQAGPVLGIACHGLLEEPAALAALTGTAPGDLDAAITLVADTVESSLTVPVEALLA